MRSTANIGWRRLARRWFSSTSKKPVQSQLSPGDTRRLETSKRLRKEVANIEIPIVQETQKDKLQQLIEERRKEIEESNESTETPQEFNIYMGLLALPKLLGVAAVISIEAFNCQGVLPILHQCVLNYGHLTVFALSGLDLAAILIGHSLSLNTVATTSRNWGRLALCLAPCFVSTYLIGVGCYGLMTVDYLMVCYAIGTAARGLYAPQLPKWLQKARFRYLFRCLLAMLLYRLYASTKPEEELTKKQEYWPPLMPEKPGETLRLSEIK